MPRRNPKFTVVDLFSGAGGMSYGFHRHPAFRMIAAADAEIGKPSMRTGSLQCNATYAANMGFAPKAVDLGGVLPEGLRSELEIASDQEVTVLSVCPPCTGFSRTNPQNHLRDDHRNGLVQKAAEFALALDAEVVVMENARELLRGNFREHYETFREKLENAGYAVSGKNHMLSRFGLPQVRERAIVIAAKRCHTLRTLDDFWVDSAVRDEDLTVRAAFEAIPKDAPGVRDFPAISDAAVKARLAAIPRNGGSWSELIEHPEAEFLMTPAMKRIVAQQKFGSHPDVYGRMSWDRPAPTIKRECAHIGNGRYAHPTKDRLCSVREMAILQGFPNEFVFDGSSLSNQYRHIGDAVPPLISYQLAEVCRWILTGRRRTVQDTLLPGTHLTPESVIPADQGELMLHA